MAKPIKSPEGKAFVEDVMKRVGAAKVRDLARMLGWDETDREGRLYVWKRGETAPNYEGTIALLRLARMLKEDEEGEAAGLPPVRLPQDPLARLEGKLDRQGEATTKTLAGLARDVRAIRTRLAPPGNKATGDSG